MQHQQSTIPSSLFSTIKFQSEKVFDCYYQLRDWDEYLDWYHEYKIQVLNRLDNEKTKQQFEKKIDIDYIKTLNSFDTQENQCVKSNSENRITFSSENLLSEDTLLINFEKKWDIRELESATFKELYKSILTKQNNSENVLTHEKAMSNSLFSFINIDENSLWNNQRIIFSLWPKLSKEENLNLSFNSKKKLDPNKHSIKFLNNIQMIIQSRRNVSDEDIEFRLAYARLARKQQNFSLASRTLIDLIKNTLCNNINNKLPKEANLSKYIGYFLDNQNMINQSISSKINNIDIFIGMLSTIIKIFSYSTKNFQNILGR